MADPMLYDMVPRSKDEETMLREMLTDLKAVNKIALVKEEENVIRRFIRGETKKNVLAYLKDKHPDSNITNKDLEDFLLMYRDVIGHELIDIEKGYVRRMIKSKTGLNNELIDLALIAKKMVSKYDGQGDNSNAVAALRTAADVFMKVAKVEGLAKDQPDVNINMQMDKIVTEVTAGDSAFKNAVLKVLETPEEREVIDADFTVSEDE